MDRDELGRLLSKGVRGRGTTWLFGAGSLRHCRDQCVGGVWYEVCGIECRP